ncbi:FCD domain-containing protein [Variovorax sp. J22P168]|uniref:FadR/GntR family transcriptional regulator n=1 Tax=Variovorax jilinensis TaxID=3053513 RepID=UPI0025755B8A|nr:FCD domain-containing protein [Variovorax sp. J22P168]MDM0015160.1 FCD domain-containing protein [Variovorax sp. J22P168]
MDDANPSQNLVEQVRVKIAKGLLKEGDRLPTEREFAEQLELSRNTVRKAMASLVQLGLVTVRKGASGGAFISLGGSQTIRTAMRDLYHLGGISSDELAEARLVLSQSVVRLACQRRTDADLVTLERNVANAEAAIARGDIASRMKINIDFYVLLGVASKNQVLTLLMDSVGQSLIQFVRSAGLLEPKDIMPVRHRIIECLRDRDQSGAVEAITTHLQTTKDLYTKPAARRAIKLPASADARG